MKFISWNVNGLRACIQKGFLDFFNRINADFFCLQETKLQAGQLELDLPGYEQYWCYAEKKGYSGTAVFTKHTPLSVRYGLGVPELDTEGRLITLEYQEFFLVTCYTPNAQRELARIDHRIRWEDAFRSYLNTLDARKPVILCGDLNVAHQEIDLKNPGPNRGSAGFSDRERAAFSKLLESGFTDTFRHLNPTATGCYTWWSYMFNARKNNAGWRIDYFLVSDRLKDAVYGTPIHADVLGSDHCPVELQLDLPCNGSIWQCESAGTAAVKEKPAPVRDLKKAVLAVIACGIFALGCAAGVLAGKLFQSPSDPDQWILYPGEGSVSSTIIPGGDPNVGGLIQISMYEAQQMTTLELIEHIAGLQELQLIASRHCSYLANGKFNSPIYVVQDSLSQEEFAALQILYPALNVLATRDGAGSFIHSQLSSMRNDPPRAMVLVMLQEHFDTYVITIPDEIYDPYIFQRMTTAELVNYVANTSDLQSHASTYVQYINGAYTVLRSLEPEIFENLRVRYPALKELATRADAAEAIYEALGGALPSTPQTAVLAVLQTLDLFHYDPLDNGVPVPYLESDS